MLVYFPIWCLGLSVFLLNRNWQGSEGVARVLSKVLFFVFIGALLLSHQNGPTQYLGSMASLILPNDLIFPPQQVSSDYLVALAFSLYILFLGRVKSTEMPEGYRRFAKGISGFSYTLYVIHYPIIVLFRAGLTNDPPWPPDNLLILVALGLCLIIITLAFTLSRFTEARTKAVRLYLKDFILR